MNCAAPSDGLVVEAIVHGEVVLAESLPTASSRAARHAVDARREGALFQLLVLNGCGREEEGEGGVEEVEIACRAYRRTHPWRGAVQSTLTSLSQPPACDYSRMSNIQLFMELLWTRLARGGGRAGLLEVTPNPETWFTVRGVIVSSNTAAWVERAAGLGEDKHGDLVALHQQLIPAVLSYIPAGFDWWVL